MSTDETGLRDESRGDIQKKKIICWPSPGCVEMCGLTATVRDGRLVSLSGTPDYPTPHKGCADRMPHHVKWLYSDRQLLHPLKRTGSGARTNGSRRGVIRQRARLSDEIDPRVVNVLTIADDPDTFDQVTGGWPLHALLCKVYK